MSEFEPPPPSPPLPLPEALWLPMLAFLIFAVDLAWQSMAYQLLLQTNLLGFPDGANVVATVKAAEEGPQARLARSRIGLWAAAISFPGFLLSLPFLLRLFPNVTPKDVGLSSQRLRHRMRAGFVLGMILTPLVVLVNFLVQWWFAATAGTSEEGHPLTLLAGASLSPFEWLLLVIGAVIVAPFTEELLFRGILQRWFIETPWSSWVGMAGALLVAVLIRSKGILASLAGGPNSFWVELIPIFFVIVLIPHFLILRRRGRTSMPAGIFASAVLFAAVHSFAWPTPVALFVLAIALGWLAQRQQSIAGSFALHATFNALNLLWLLAQALNSK